LLHDTASGRSPSISAWDSSSRVWRCPHSSSVRHAITSRTNRLSSERCRPRNVLLRAKSFWRTTLLDANLSSISQAGRPRLAFGPCAAMAGVGTAMASQTILLLLVPIASLAAAFPVHPFDLIYNHGIRFVTGTLPLPRARRPLPLCMRFRSSVARRDGLGFPHRACVSWIRAGRATDRRGGTGEHN
jgi:hypothetical protein